MTSLNYEEMVKRINEEISFVYKLYDNDLTGETYNNYKIRVFAMLDLLSAATGYTKHYKITPNGLEEVPEEGGFTVIDEEV